MSKSNNKIKENVHNKDKKYLVYKDWKAADVVMDFLGIMYIIIGVGVTTEDNVENIIYKKLDGTGNILITPRDIFESYVDMEKYPEARQENRFVIIDTHENSDVQHQ